MSISGPKRLFIGCVTIVGLAIGVSALLLAVKWSHMGDMDKRHALLFKVDHDRLLSDCRTILGSPGRYRHNPGIGGSWPATHSYPDPDDPAISPVIRSLTPFQIEVQEDHMRILCEGGFYHLYGIVAFKRGTTTAQMEATMERFSWPSLKLTDGLYYIEAGPEQER